MTTEELHSKPILVVSAHIQWDRELPPFYPVQMIGKRYSHFCEALFDLHAAAAQHFYSNCKQPGYPAGRASVLYIVYPSVYELSYYEPANFVEWIKTGDSPPPDSTTDDPFMERSGPPSSSSTPSSPLSSSSIYAVYSNDDGVVLCSSKAEADTLVANWIERGAGGVDGPFGPFDVGGRGEEGSEHNDR